MLSRFPCWNGYNDWVEKYQLMENTATATTMKISWIVKWIHDYTNKLSQINKWIREQQTSTYKWMNEWMNEWMNG